MNMRLKPCPLCGGKAIEHWYENGNYQIGCSNGEGLGCNICGPVRSSRLKAIKVWNTRPQEESFLYDKFVSNYDLALMEQQIIEINTWAVLYERETYKALQYAIFQIKNITDNIIKRKQIEKISVK